MARKKGLEKNIGDRRERDKGAVYTGQEERIFDRLHSSNHVT